MRLPSVTEIMEEVVSLLEAHTDIFDGREFEDSTQINGLARAAGEATEVLDEEGIRAVRASLGIH